MTTKFCFACMNPIDSPEAVCPHCGHDNHIRDNGPGLLSGGTLAGKYIIGRLLGRGGFGATYMGYDTFLQRRVAIKEYFPTNLVMRDGNSSNLSIINGGAESFAKGKERALRESRMAAGLGSVPGIVQIHDVLSANNTIYIVMEYVEGDTLTRYVEKQPEKLSLSRAMTLMGQVAAALSALHHRKVIHRDVKPDNIIIRKDPEQGVLLDFGAAKVDDGTTMSNSSAVVSPGFAPPEQYNAASLDGRIDQYAFAATLYYMLTGQRPTDSIMRMVSGTPLPSIHQLNPAVPEAAEKVIMKGMAVKDGERYGSMEEFWGELEKAAGKIPPKPKPKPVPTPPKGKMGLIAILASIGLALIALLLVFALPKKECEHEWVPGTCLTVKHCAKCNATVADGFGAHVWQEATCQAPQTCEVCQITVGGILDHYWQLGTCTEPKTCAYCGLTEGEPLGHQWYQADCVTPKTCPLCGLIEGEALGHKWVEADCVTPKTCSVCAVTEGNALGHSWVEADCVTAKICSVCEATEGNALGHVWVEATCEHPKTCSVCKITEGELAAHTWKEATYIAPKTCTVCAVTEGEKKERPPVVLDAGYDHTVGLKSDGTVVAVGDNQDGECNVSGWKDIVQVAAGGDHTVGLKSDGRVVAVGQNASGQCNISDWTDIVQVSAGGGYTVGLKSDGTVVATIVIDYLFWENHGQCDVSGWKDIVQVSAGGYHTVGLKSDGTVVAAGSNNFGQCDVSGWTDIVAISAGHLHTVGLKSDGTVVAVGSNSEKKYSQCDVSDWTDIVQVSAGGEHTIGVKSDGTVVATGTNNYGQCFDIDWTDVIQVSTGMYHTVGLKSDGTVAAAGYSGYDQCNVTNWRLMPINPITTNDSSSSANSQLASANIGDYVTFGKYEQDGDESNGKEDIEWLVLDKQGDRMLVISKHGLEGMPYNTEKAGVTWETCTLRKWLNGDFIDIAFSEKERDLLVTVEVLADKNPKFSTNPGNNTEDKVFLLGLTEAKKYFPSKSSSKCKPTPYARTQGVWKSNSGYCWWWLRSPGGSQGSATLVYADQGIDRNGLGVTYKNGAVRPAMWIDLNP